MEPRFVDGAPITFAGLERRYKFNEIEGIAKLWNVFGPQINHIANQVGEVAYGVCHAQDQSSFAYIAAVEVSGTSGLPEEFVILDWPARRYAAFTHEGDVTTLRDTLGWIWREWLPQSSVEADTALGFFERYGEKFDPATMSEDIEIWIPIKS